MKKWLLSVVTAITVLLTSCSIYREEFTKYDNHGIPNHTVQVTYGTFLMLGEAGQLRTSTQTEDFIREVNAQDAKSATDKESISAITEGVVRALVKP